tara:strand:- start:16498 stop:16842 length:345 start_codon:yes stop_codon:yes gene_type:complete
VCEQLGQEPDPAKMPLEPSAFPEEVQVAFFIYGLLSDRWDGMSGTYLGKDWNSLEYIFKLYNIDNPKEVFFFLKLYESIIVSNRAEETEKKRKLEERKKRSSGGGKQYTHKVSG